MSMRKAHGLRLQTSIVQDNVPVEVAAGLFIGSIHAAFNAEALKSNKISHVLNLAGSYATFPEDFTYLSLSIRDKEYASLLSCLPIAAVFIDAGLKHGGVLIHCAGGRSRSPAVAMAFVMMKQQMSYSAISAQVKAQRPVVSLNVGFEAQLKCLEFAGGDVFVANQHLLKARLTRLAQQHEDGELASEVAKKRRQSQQTSSQSPPPPLLKKQSSIEMLASGCDDRGMLGERVPSGFCLSTPSRAGCSEVAAGKVPPASSFIPALRSMGTVYGCQRCGESLFCAGAIVYHHDMGKLTRQSDTWSAESGSTRFLNALRGQTISNSTSDVAPSVPVSDEQVIEAESVTKKPLLAKLRLRPHSPSVTMGNGSQTASCSDTFVNRRKSGPPVLTKPHIGAEGSLKDEEEECGVGFQTLQPTRRPATEESNRTGSATLSPSKANGDTKKKAGSALWRSLTSFKSSKRVAKATIEGNIQNRTGVLELQKPGVSSFASEDNKAAAVGQMPAHLVFLRRNAAEWQRCVQQLVGIDKDVASESSGGSIIAQVSALIDEDSTVLVALNDCKQWFVDPQLWTIDQAKTNPEGEIHCPREACGAIVGDWRWEGLRYACGGSVAPAFVMKRDAVCVLGNMTSQSAELMAAASSDTHPEK
ncbi:Dual specificity protein phosphatase 1 [Phytophthora ramorum]|uniref:Dual specificity protein phosphatase 1 n=1 Tax=Phytophthora ramorum TaxID=164328 RepID=UPI00309CDE40|nr:Dual specificity protein phosphatase 1 [Phytophthora ramorum]